MHGKRYAVVGHVSSFSAVTFRKFRQLLEQQEGLSTFLVFKTYAVFETAYANQRRYFLHIANHVLHMSVIRRTLAPQNDLNASGRRSLALKTHPNEWQIFFFLLRANLTDDFEPGGAQLIAFAELVKKGFPLILFYETWHILLHSLCSIGGGLSHGRADRSLTPLALGSLFRNAELRLYCPPPSDLLQPDRELARPVPRDRTLARSPIGSSRSKPALDARNRGKVYPQSLIAPGNLCTGYLVH